MCFLFFIAFSSMSFPTSALKDYFGASSCPCLLVLLNKVHNHGEGGDILAMVVFIMFLMLCP